jgi:Rifampin ADP-ribosyl transferase
MAIEPGPQFYYHGTTADFNPGDVVTPREALGTESNFETVEDKTGWNLGSMAYATTTPEGAEWYAKNKAKKDQAEGKIYKVEPVNQDDIEEDIYGGGADFSAVQSPSGFKVVKRHK